VCFGAKSNLKQGWANPIPRLKQNDQISLVTKSGNRGFQSQILKLAWEKRHRPQPSHKHTNSHLSLPLCKEGDL
ncbi:hypothetical protein DVA81_18555, partial [Acinetobacter baumannii]